MNAIVEALAIGAIAFMACDMVGLAQNTAVTRCRRKRRESVEQEKKLIERLRERAGAMEYDGWVETAIDFEKAADVIEKLSKRVEKIDNIYCIEFSEKIGDIGTDYVAYFDARKVTKEEAQGAIDGFGSMNCHPYIAVIPKSVAMNVFGYQEGK